MAEGRRTSMRLREPAPKRLAVTTRVGNTEKPTPAPAPKSTLKISTKGGSRTRAPPAPIAKEETPPPVDPLDLLPNRIQDGKPLPSLPDPQGEALDSSWQSVADSGVLVASIQRSRQRWLHETMFEKYWSKATYKKKKDPAEMEKEKQAKDRPPMTRAGTCKIIVEPHIFDATLFVVRDLTAQPQPVSGERQFVSYGPVGGQHPVQYQQPPAQYGGQHLQPKPLPAGLTHGNSPLPISPISQPVTPGPTAQQTKPIASSIQASAPRPTPPTYSTPASTSATTTPAKPGEPAATPSQQPRTTGSTSASRPATTAPAPSTNDPVIQLLAHRASKDPHLKSIMKIVATGKASQEQLVYFQGHIEQLTNFVKAQEKKKEETAAAKAQAAATPSNQKPVPSGSVTGPRSAFTAQSGTSAQNRVPLPPQNAAQRPLYAPSPMMQPPKPKPAAPPPQHVLIEFQLNSHDRFLFPKYSIIEQQGPQRMLVSFLVVKRPSELAAEVDAVEAKKSRKKADKSELKNEPTVTANTPVLNKEDDIEMYQLVTMRLESPSDGNLFSLIGRVVAPVEAVQKHMRDVVERCEMAPKKHLALRLPRESKQSVI